MKFGNPFSGAQLLRSGVLATLATGVLATAAGRGTLAYFTTTNTSTGNTFAAGSLKFNIAAFAPNDDIGAGLTTVANTITATDMRPGDVRYAAMSLTNVGVGLAKYGITYTSTT